MAEFHTELEYLAVEFVLLVQKMHVAGGDDLHRAGELGSGVLRLVGVCASSVFEPQATRESTITTQSSRENSFFIINLFSTFAKEIPAAVLTVARIIF